MYVIRVSGTEALDAIHKRANAAVYLPTERCTWEILDIGSGGYDISHVYFWHLIGATESTRLDGVSGIVVDFGYIGKSGRFVQMTV